MRSFARTSLGLLGLALIAPITAQAQDAAPSAPAGYQSVAPATSPATAPVAAAVPVGPDGKPIPAAAVEPPHKHKFRTLCAKCAAKQAAMQANVLPPGTIVGCEHSKNGVCTACAAALKMPGQFVMQGSPAPAAEAPGRAVASSGPAVVRPGVGGSAVAYDNGAEPVPVGVVQANFSPASPMGASASFAPPASQPGHAVAESSAGHEPYQPKSGWSHPHILGHLFGWSGIGAERAEERARRKAEAHAMISYDSNGNSSSSVEDLPASAVYGKKR